MLRQRTISDSANEVGRVRNGWLRRGLMIGLALGLLAFAAYWFLASNHPVRSLAQTGTASDGSPQPADFVFLTESTYNRGIWIGDVLSNRFGLSARQLASLPVDMSREVFYDWLQRADKLLETTSLLRVPQLRSERPILDGQDIYDGFFAPQPDLWDFAAPLEGSVSVLKKQGFTFNADDLKALDAMLRATMGKGEAEAYRWHAFPVGSRILLQAGARPAVTIWRNAGEQRPTPAETLTCVQDELVVQTAITDPAQASALNKHFNYALEAKDERIERNSHGKYHTPREKLFDVVQEYLARQRAKSPTR